MSLFKQLYDYAFTPDPAGATRNLHSALMVDQQHPLPKDYMDIVETHWRSHDPEEMFQEWLKGFAWVTTPGGMVKVVTVTLKILKARQYQAGYLDSLEDVVSPQLVNEWQGWGKQLWLSLKAYLRRLSAKSEVLNRCLSSQKTSVPAYDDLFVLINLYSVLFPSLNSTFNTIGRYYLRSSPSFAEFYAVLREELLVGYHHMQLITRHFIAHYEALPLQQLACLVDSIPETQLLCDRVEELLMNKYFKGKPPARKIYFKEEEIQAMQYHLSVAGKAKSESVRTVPTREEDDDFLPYCSSRN